MKPITSFVLGLLLLSFAIAPSGKAEPIQVGVALRFTPDMNSNAGDLYEGIQLAADDFNEKNPKIAVKLVKYPHKNGHDSVEDAAQKIVDDKVQYVIGGEMSDEAFTLAETFKDHSILFLTPTASNPLLTAGNPLTFRTCFSDDDVAREFAKALAAKKSIHSVGVLHNTASAYSDYVTNAFLDRYEALVGKRVTLHEFRYAGEAPQFDSAVEEFKKAKVDTVVAFTLLQPLKSFYTAAQKAGLNPLYVGSDGWGTTEGLLKDIPGFTGLRNDYWNPNERFLAAALFKKAIQKKYDHPANAWNAQGYDTAWVLFQAIARASAQSKAKSKDVTVDDVAKVLRSDTFRGTVTARSIRFGRNQTAEKKMELYRIGSGEGKKLK